jgi:hypothetical protein
MESSTKQSMEKVGLTSTSKIGGVAEIFVDGGRPYRTSRAWFWDFVIQLILGAGVIAFGVCFIVYFVRWNELKTDVAARACPTMLQPSSTTMTSMERKMMAQIVNETAQRQCVEGQSLCPSGTFGVYVAPAAWCKLSAQNTLLHLEDSTGVNPLKVQTSYKNAIICDDNWDYTHDYSRKNSFYACLSPAQVHIVMMLPGNAAGNATCGLCSAPYEADNVKMSSMGSCVMKYTSEGIMVCARS